MDSLLIDGHRATVVYDPETKQYRGEFVGLSGGADLYSPDIAGLEAEGRASLRVYLDLCLEKGIAPFGR